MSTPKMIVLGPQGTNTDEVGTNLIAQNQLPDGQKLEMQFVLGNSDLLPALEKAPRGSYAIMPIENSSAGFVREVIYPWIDLGGRRDEEGTSEFRPRIIKEVSVPITHQLLVRPEINSVEEIEEVLSHPQALMQCRRNLGHLNLWENRVATTSTAEAAAIVAASSINPRKAALASSFACQINGLKPIKLHMQDLSNNSTRFHVVTQTTGINVVKKDRTAILCWADNRPGSLVTILQCISRYNANMSSLDSVPLGRGTEKYAFYIEFDTEGDMWSFEKIISELRQHSKRVFLLGSFAKENK